MQGAVKFHDVEPIQDILKIRVVVQQQQRVMEGHRQFQQGRIRGEPFPDEIDESVDVADRKGEILLFRKIFDQLV